MHPQTLQTWPRGDGHWLPEPTTCFEKVRFHKIGLIMMPKRIGYKIYTMFLIYTCKRHKMTKTGKAYLMKCTSIIYF